MREQSEETTYLERLQEHLRWLDATERQEVVAEIRSHIAEAQARGETVSSVLARLGPADRLARAYTAGALIERRDGFRLLSPRWLAASALLLTTSIVSFIVVPMLVIFAVGFSITGALGLGFGVATFFVPELAQSRVFEPPTPAGQVFLLALAVILITLGRLSLLILRAYLRLLTRSLRVGLAGLGHAMAI